MFHCSWLGTAPPYSKSWWTKTEFLQPMLGSGTERQTTNKQKGWRWNSRYGREAYVQHKAYRGLLSQRLPPCPWVPRCWQTPAVQRDLFKGSRQRSALLSAHRLYTWCLSIHNASLVATFAPAFLRAGWRVRFQGLWDPDYVLTAGFSGLLPGKCNNVLLEMCNVTQGAEEDSRRMPKTWVMSARTHAAKT